jgi:hypothetical protein
MLFTIRLTAALVIGPIAAFAQAPAANPESAKIREWLDGSRITQMLHVAAKLKIADLVNDGPLTVKDLAQRTQTHEDSLYRLLRALAGLGVFKEQEGMRFAQTPTSNLLRSDVPGSLRVSAQVAGETWMWGSWGALMHSIKTGEVAFDHLYGKHTWEWFAENPEPAQLFNAFMDEQTGLETQSVVKAYDFSGASTIADIGGGRGALLAAILKQHGNARGVLFDLPHVIAAAKQELPAPVASRVEFASGDFLRRFRGARIFTSSRTSFTIGPTSSPSKFSRPSAQR